MPRPKVLTLNARRTIFQLYFDYIQHFGSAITPRALVRLTTELGISPNATRAALCRLAQQGWLERNTGNGQTFYLLTPLGRERLDEIHPRLFSPRHGTWDGRWTILTYSVPERLARHRDRLRRELTFLGYGSMTPATWISPNPLVDITLRHLALHNLEKYVCLFRAQQISAESPSLLIKRCYSLDAVQRHYLRFIKSWRGYRDKINAAKRPSDNECFVAKIKLLYAFGDSLYLDPFLPAEFLPSEWLGYEAWRIFRDSYLSLMEPALAFFESCYEGPSDQSVRTAGRLRAMEQAPFDANISA
jgi:phenylacetic acid degradation operon negative regulatory protein